MYKKAGLECPNCGSNKYVVNHAGGSTTTFLMCKSCGKKGTQEAWDKGKEIRQDNGDSFNLKAFNLKNLKLAVGIGDVDQLASDKPLPENDPQTAFKGKSNREKRTNNIDRLRDRRYDSEDVKANSDGEIKMAFNLKNIKANKTECGCVNNHVEHMCKECSAKSKTAQKPFNLMKIAREFRYTEDQLARKELNKNVVFPEGRQDIDLKTKGKGSDGNSIDEKYIGVEENRRFDSVDRKDAHTPDPKQLIPGYKRWYDNEVDKYYDGWLDDHIENSGGKVVGSNTEKTMNLNDDERYHEPKYPTEASYERLLENRHNFDDDYKRKVAFNLSSLKKESSKKKI